MARQASSAAIPVGGHGRTEAPPDIIELVQQQREATLQSLMASMAGTAPNIRELWPSTEGTEAPLEPPNWPGFRLDLLNRDLIAGIDTSPSQPPTTPVFDLKYPDVFPGLGGVLRTPPYDWAVAEPAQAEMSQAGHVIRSASADRRGQIALESLIWAGYPGARELVGGNYRVKLADPFALIGATMPIPSALRGARLRVHCTVEVHGSGLVTGGFFEPARGYGWVQLLLTLLVYGGPNTIGLTHHWMDFASASAQFTSPQMGVVQSVSQHYRFDAQVEPTDPERPLLVAIHATLWAAVMSGSNLVAMGNFSPSSTWAQPAGRIGIPFIYLTTAE